MKKILLFEDDPLLVRIYQVLLKKAGFESVIQEDGSNALQVVKTEHPNLIVVDLIMPKKDGFAVLSDLQTDPQTKQIPVLVLSVLGSEEDRKRTAETGVLKHLDKTEYSYKQVVELVKETLS